MAMRLDSGESQRGRRAVRQLEFTDCTGQGGGKRRDDGTSFFFWEERTTQTNGFARIVCTPSQN
ncbi:hypothetical protein BD324DRAFT_639391, partial [Kockovaella imperatae]